MAMRLIDADFLCGLIHEKLKTHNYLGLGEMFLYAVKDLLDTMPTIDAVEVVRCKDCKHFDGECCDRYADETLGYSHSTQPNFFCACGERKTDV